ncbi:rod shape-determining protein MreC [Sulfuricurvum sp.]|uniref:rod shape-determining protein MreC n=1 Tax=Sulfuricurvum sp. TaxID=2025608 RepID=UPI001993C272|nr:rod shape-determining protein MreC [Sulfuricurvum sp.]MBD3799278.1 rod shape-determining protein MreC [Campylobacterota bacterium]MBD3805735.1 rod shape-determining protein MreC [Sulfuricurvum sp.]
MNKNSLLIGGLLALAVGGALYFTNLLQSPIIYLNLSLKIAYKNTLESIQNGIDEHFRQQATIIDLRRKNQFYEQELLNLHQVADEYQKLLIEHNSSFQTSPSTRLIRTISYVRFGDPHRVWVEMDHFDPTKVYGLLYRGYAAGIVVSKDKRPMALLNGDLKSSYAVNVGASMAPGIVRGNNKRQLIVEFIPTWIPISVGDEVLTSGLDQIFMAGLKVGKVISITKASGYQSAIIEPYFYGKNPAYFHVITHIR